MNVPKLRFKEFNDEWNLIRLGDCCNLITKGTTPNRFSESGIKFIKIESLINKKIDNNKCLYVDEKTHITSLKRSVLEEKDVLFAIAGATIGKCGIIEKENLPSNTNQALAILRTNPKKLNPYFLLNVLDSNIMKKYILLNISVGAQPNLNLEQMNNFKFKLPSKEEQLKVANFLSLLDKKIELQSKKIEDLKLFKLSIKNNIFKSFDKEQKMSIEELLEFEQPIKYIVKSEEYTDNRDDIPVLTANKAFILGYCKEGNFYNKECIIFDDFTLDMKYVNFAFKVKSSAIKILTPKENINIKYIYEYMQFLNLHSEEHKRHYISIVQKIQIPVPIFKIQNKIATQLNCFDSKIELENNKLLKLTELKKGLMQNMFV